MRLYLDTSPLIFVVERVEPQCAIVVARISQPDVALVTCELAWLETRIKPLKNNDAAQLADFELFFEGSLASVLPLDRRTMTKAAELRAAHRFKTPDAIHLAAAILGRCDIFYTNDHDLKRCPEIAVEIISVFESE